MPSVRATEGLERVRALPRRDWLDYPMPELVEYLTNALRSSTGTQTLRPIQAVSLAELHDFGGLFAPIQVGGGKTLLSLLAPRVVQAKRPVLIVPAALREKTKRDYTEYAKHWNLQPIHIQSYETLSRSSGYDWLEAKCPDLIIADECHRLKNTRAACTRKVSRYLSKYRRKGHTIRVCLMSGTATSRSLRDFWHLIRWSLGDHAPVPPKWDEMMEWALAIDSKVDAWSRLSPGALLRLGAYDPQEDETTQARQAFGDRLYHTPGVVILKGGRPEAGLEVGARVVQLPPAMDAHFEHLRTNWETPDGHPFEDSITMWRHARELACGFYYKWDPRPPEEWIRARRAWSAFVRDVLAHSRTIDSPMQLAQAVDSGLVTDWGLLNHWREIRPTFEPNSVPVWCDDTVLREAERWLSRNPGLCWVEHRAFGQALAEITGLPHFQEKGLDPKTGTLIDQHKGPAIVQAKPCSTGFNLQQYSHNLIVSCEPTGKQYEQLVGRTHRSGQTADTVTVEQIFACREQLTGFWQAVSDAEFASQAVSDAEFASQAAPSEQKLAYATLDVPHWDDPVGDGAAWKK